jgi:hypothetical protein
MKTIVENLRAHVSEDHLPGCDGRFYDCTCGYDKHGEEIMTEAAARIDLALAAIDLAMEIAPDWPAVEAHIRYARKALLDIRR